MEIPDKALEQVSKARPVDRVRISSSGKKSKATGGAPPTDEVTISSQGRLLAALQAAVSAAPEVRAERVEALRKAIAAGTYSVDFENLARKLLDLA